MIKTLIFRTRLNLEKVLLNYSGIYGVDSLIEPNLKYGISDGLFALLWPTHAKYCPIKEAPKLAEEEPDLKEEIMAIYADVKDLGLERVWK